MGTGVTLLMAVIYFQSNKGKKKEAQEGNHRIEIGKKITKKGGWATPEEQVSKRGVTDANTSGGICDVSHT